MSYSILIRLSVFIIFLPFSLISQWEKSNLPEGRANINSVTIDENIYFIGGKMGTGERYEFMDVLHVPTDNWTTIELPGVTEGPRSVIVGKRIYIGEFNGKKIHIYDTTNSNWTNIDTPDSFDYLSFTDSLLLIHKSGFLATYNLVSEKWDELEIES